MPNAIFERARPTMHHYPIRTLEQATGANAISSFQQHAD